MKLLNEGMSIVAQLSHLLLCLHHNGYSKVEHILA